MATVSLARDPLLAIEIVLGNRRGLLPRMFLGQRENFTTTRGIMNSEVCQNHFQRFFIGRPAYPPHNEFSDINVRWNLRR